MCLETIKSHGFDKPFMKDGKPKKWLALLIPLMKEERVTKLKLLNSINPTITSRNYKQKRGSHSSVLAELVKAGVLKTRERGRGIWERGENWDSFMKNMFDNMIEHPELRSRVIDMMVKYDSNAIDFIVKD